LLAASAISRAGLASRDLESSLAALQRIEKMSGNGQLDETIIELLQGRQPAMAPIEAATKAAAVLKASLGGSMPDGEALKLQLQDESSSYVWVQARLSNQDAWDDYHTAFTPKSTIKVDHIYGDTLPATAFHRMSVRLSVEVSENGKLSQTALLADVDVSFAKSVQMGVPLALVTADVLRGVEKPKNSDDSYYVPLISGDLADGTQAFNNKGELVDARLLLNDSIGSQSTSNAFGSLGGMLGGINTTIGGTADNDVETNQKQAVGFILTLSYRPAFSQEPVVFSRLLIDRVGQDGRASGDFQLSKNTALFAGNWTILSNGGQVGIAQLFDTQIDQFMGLNRQEYSVSNDRFSAITTAALYDDIARSAADEDTLMYRANPFIAIFAFVGTTDTTGRVGFDIVSSGLRVLAKKGHSWIPDTSTALRAGVAETMLEGAIVESVASMFNKLEFSSAWHSLESNNSFTIISRQAVLDENISNKTIAKIAQAELDRGQLIALTGTPEVAWWRVDSVSGIATGVDRFGRGSGTLEMGIEVHWTIKSIDYLSTLYFLVEDWKACFDSPSWTSLAKMHALPLETAAQVGIVSVLTKRLKLSGSTSLVSFKFTLTSVLLELLGVGLDC
jgi:hypothetical protein